MGVSKIENRLGEEKLNNQGCLMKIVEYNGNNNMVVEFQDKYKARVHCIYQAFCNGKVKNPYYPQVCGVGMIGIEYKAKINGKITKEYDTWKSMLRRCFDIKHKEKYIEYKDITCCNEWLLYENFYKWLHSQENFDKWNNGYRWAIDKDILLKGNKVYSPENCCLVPQNVNSLFTKRKAYRGDLPLGVQRTGNYYYAVCKNPFTNKQEKFNYCLNVIEAFLAYKQYKENVVQQVAKIEYDKGNITQQCYDAMMDYKVEITD